MYVQHYLSYFNNKYKAKINCSTKKANWSIACIPWPWHLFFDLVMGKCTYFRVNLQPLKNYKSSTEIELRLRQTVLKNWHLRLVLKYQIISICIRDAFSQNFKRILINLIIKSLFLRWARPIIFTGKNFPRDKLEKIIGQSANRNLYKVIIPAW